MIYEMSMIGKETFEHLDLALKIITQNSSPFGGVSLLVVGDFLQLPPVNPRGAFGKLSKGSYSPWMAVGKISTAWAG